MGKYAINDAIVPDNTGTESTEFLNEVGSGQWWIYTIETEDRTGFQLIDEDRWYSNYETGKINNLNDITDVKVTNQGGGYTSLPTLSITSITIR